MVSSIMYSCSLLLTISAVRTRSRDDQGEGDKEDEEEDIEPQNDEKDREGHLQPFGVDVALDEWVFEEIKSLMFHLGHEHT